jgi:hypothetical protein
MQIIIKKQQNLFISISWGAISISSSDIYLIVCDTFTSSKSTQKTFSTNVRSLFFYICKPDDIIISKESLHQLQANK